jgi:hypothetical protein
MQAEHIARAFTLFKGDCGPALSSCQLEPIEAMLALLERIIFNFVKRVGGRLAALLSAKRNEAEQGRQYACIQRSAGSAI